MEEFKSFEETLAQKIERLRPIFIKSLEVFADERRNLKEGALSITRIDVKGKKETVANLVVVDINDDGPELAGIDEEGNPTASATMLWEEIVDAK